MIAVAPRLYLHPGPPKSEELNKLSQNGWAVLSAARNPWFVDHYMKTHPGDLPVYREDYEPDQLYLQDGSRLYLNIVDADSIKFFQPAIFDAAMEFLITQHGMLERKTLIHCNMGMSRSPSLAMLYMAMSDQLPSEFEYAVLEFKKLYGFYEPGAIRDWIKLHWDEYV